MQSSCALCLLCALVVSARSDGAADLLGDPDAWRPHVNFFNILDQTVLMEDTLFEDVSTGTRFGSKVGDVLSKTYTYVLCFSLCDVYVCEITSCKWTYRAIVFMSATDFRRHLVALTAMCDFSLFSMWDFSRFSMWDFEGIKIWTAVAIVLRWPTGTHLGDELS